MWYEINNSSYKKKTINILRRWHSFSEWTDAQTATKTSSSSNMHLDSNVDEHIAGRVKVVAPGPDHFFFF